MKKNFFLSFALLACILASSCTDNEISNNEKEQLLNRVTVSGDDIMYEENPLLTRTSYSMETSLKFSWSNGDVLGIYPVGGTQVDFPISSGDGSKSADFDGGAWALRSHYTYAAYYPFSNANFHVEQTQIPVSYEGQTQNGNNSLAHIGKYDFMAAAATQPSSNGSVSLAMKHLGSFIRLQLTMPVADSFSKVTLSTEDGTQFTQTAKYDLTAETPTLTPVSTSASYSIDLINVNTIEPNEVITVYGFVGPLNLLGKKLTITVKGTINSTYVAEVDGKNMVARQGYNYATDFKKGTNASGDDISFVDDTPYLTFKAKESQTIFMSDPVDKLEYSVNNGEWALLGTNEVSFGGNIGDLRLRGKCTNGTGIVKYGFVYDESPKIYFTEESQVECSGDIRTLIDYENYNTTDTHQAVFACLFKGAPLTTAPELPATNLADYCYADMFAGCKHLISAPVLPATTLTKYCYYGMFADCNSLISAPELPAIVLAESSYNGMFKNCTTLRVAPELSATTLSGACYSYMFKGCTSLEYAPTLPAEILTEGCYQSMFENCTSLYSAPDLPATTLTVGCYYEMFKGCSNLNKITMLATDISAMICLQNWLSGVASSGTIIKNASANWTGNIPDGWNIQYYIPPFNPVYPEDDYPSWGNI